MEPPSCSGEPRPGLRLPCQPALLHPGTSHSGQPRRLMHLTFVSGFYRHRHSLGLSASVLNIGAIKGVGYLSENYRSQEESSHPRPPLERQFSRYHASVAHELDPDICSPAALIQGVLPSRHGSEPPSPGPTTADSRFTTTGNDASKSSCPPLPAVSRPSATMQAAIPTFSPTDRAQEIWRRRLGGKC